MTRAEALTRPGMFGCLKWKLTLHEKACLVLHQRFDMWEATCSNCSWGHNLRKKYKVKRISWGWSAGEYREAI